MKKKYKKLKGFSSFAYQKLFLGQDHLLVSDGYMIESYRRLYFTDIETITYSRTGTYSVMNYIFGAITFIGLLLVSSTWNNPTAAWTLGFFFLAIPFLMLMANLIKGPSCLMEVTTGVQRIKLRCVSRERKAKSILKRTIPLIARAQGRESPLSTEELESGSTEPAAAS